MPVIMDAIVTFMLQFIFISVRKVRIFIKLFTYFRFFSAEKAILTVGDISF